MLRELHISGLGVIDDLDLPLHPGLNVLTGETGAGKTMITVGLALALGARASVSAVREGARAARVQALFDVAEPPPGAREALEAWTDDDEVLLARSVPAEGKGSARIGGQLATASALASIGGALVEVHGQFQAQRLLLPAVQTGFLDRFAGDEHLVAVAAYREAFEAFRVAEAELDRLREAGRDRERELDLLAYQVREIGDVGPEPGESERLIAEAGRLGHVERLQEAATAAGSALDDDERGASLGLGAAANALDEAAGLDPGAGELAARASAVALEASELAHDVRAYRESLAADPSRLQLARERLAALKALQRKYGERDVDVIEFMRTAARRLAELEGADDRIAKLEADVGTLAERLATRGAMVSGGRTEAAGRLAAAIGGELEQLGMPGAVVEVALEPLEAPAVNGLERVELRFAGGPETTPMPLAKTASGGELSRTMLACRSVLADLDDVPTLVFDEVDAGIGGRAGLAVGRRLAALATGRQVLVVTHLPQIACFADRHVRVTKHGSTAAVEVLDDAERVGELSRMLAGLGESEAAVSHARELLHEAGATKAGVG